ncbi:tRNA lysidine(34) synthetase TilS [Tahibacter amnicola]
MIQGLDPATLQWQAWIGLPDALRGPVLREWLRGLALAPPEHFHIDQLHRQLTCSQETKLLQVSWHGAEVRRYRTLLYAMAPTPAPPPDWQFSWHGHPLELPPGSGTLALRDAKDGSVTLQEPLTVRLRNGGETIKPAGDRHTRELRDLWQGAGVPPWQRGRMPLVYRGNTLAAVGDLWQTDSFRDWLDAQGARLVWTLPPSHGDTFSIDRHLGLR